MGTLCIFLNFKLIWPKSAKLRGGVVTGASIRCDMGGGGASDLLFHVCIITLHGGAIRWANEFKKYFLK